MPTTPCHALAAIAWVVCCLPASAAVGQQPGKGADPPAVTEEYTLEIDGKSVDVRAGEAATVEVAGKKVRAKITAKPDKLFRAGSVSFRVPKEYSLETEAEPDGTTMWTLDGDNGVLILVRFGAAQDPKEGVETMVDYLKGQYGEANVKTSPVSLKLGDRVQQGMRVSATVAGQRLVQDLFAWKSGGATYLLTVQETPQDDGSSVAELRRVRQLLADTFRSDASAK